MENQVEIWKAHPDIDKIEVSSFGRVRSSDGHYYNSHRTNKGYLNVRIKIDGNWTAKLVHRLVAQTFIENPDNLPEVNHRDCDRANNNAGNLEWCTHQENVAYRDKLGHTARNNAPKSPVYAINLATLEVSRFPSQMEAGRSLGILYQSIYKVLKGRINQTGGYWFVNDDGHAVDVVKSKLHNIGGIGLKIKQGR